MHQYEIVLTNDLYILIDHLLYYIPLDIQYLKCNNKISIYMNKYDIYFNIIIRIILIVMDEMNL